MNNTPTNGAWTLAQLVAADAIGDLPELLLFWGHTAPASGQIGPHVFSQWYPHDFTIDDVVYRTAEHYMMAEKARLFGDREALEQILAAESPADAKKGGRNVRDFTDELWKQHRIDIVRRASVAKFASNDELRAYLVGTGDKVLVEASPPDRIWGIGMGRDDSSAERPSQWRGLNLLGFALMQARAELANGGVV